MIITLNGTNLPRIKEINRDTIWQKQDRVMINGKLTRDYTSKKEVFTLFWEMLTETEINTILAIIDLNTPVEFYYSDNDYEITTTLVHVSLSDIEYTILGGDYLGRIEVQLLEVS